MLEGGGQILRITAAMSAICSRPVRVVNIRANRSKPGLRPQHLAGLRLVADICGGELEGAKVGSCEITMKPRRIRIGSFQADPGTAGSCCLLAQAPLSSCWDPTPKDDRRRSDCVI
jgi:RNA 3'-terminal phosphate cyclase (ATP)